MPNSYHGATLIPDIRHGATMIDHVYHGATPVWHRATIRDDFDGTAATLDSDWTIITGGSWSTDYKLGMNDGYCRVMLPDGAVGGIFDTRVSGALYTDETALSDDGYVEVRMATRGDGFSLTALTGFNAHVFGRMPPAAYTHGVGIGFNAGRCYICSKISGTNVERDNGGNYQPGDRIRLTYVDRDFVLTVNGTETADWTDGGAVTAKGSGYRTLGIDAMAGKDFLGPRRFGPAFDYVVMS